MPERRRDLDMIRALVVLGLIFFHTARIFDHGDFYVKNDPPSMLISIIVIFVSMWGMPLLFMISGIGVWYSLRSRSPGAFVRERFLRLLVPLVFGTLVIVPPQQYYSVLFKQPDLHVNYGELLSEFIKVKPVFDFPYFLTSVPPLELFQLAHLWFLNLLFFFTLLLLPIFLYLRTPGGERICHRMASLFSRPWTIFLLGLPLGLIEAGLKSEMTGSWNRYGYLIFLFYGFFLVSDGHISQTIQKHWKSAIVLGLISFVLLSAGFNALLTENGTDPMTSYDWGSILLRILKGLTGWFWIVGILGFVGQKQKKNKNTRIQTPELPAKQKFLDRVVPYFSEAVLPFYVLHQTVIVVIGFYVLQWRMTTFFEYWMISLASLVATLVLYDVGVKRLNVTRFLFGMRKKH